MTRVQRCEYLLRIVKSEHLFLTVNVTGRHPWNALHFTAVQRERASTQRIGRGFATDLASDRQCPYGIAILVIKHGCH